VTAREAEKACATKGLTVVAEGSRGGDLACIMAIRRYGIRTEIVASFFDDELPGCVRQFKGWRAEWQKGGAK